MSLSLFSVLFVCICIILRCTALLCQLSIIFATLSLCPQPSQFSLFFRRGSVSSEMSVCSTASLGCPPTPAGMAVTSSSFSPSSYSSGATIARTGNSAGSCSVDTTGRLDKRPSHRSKPRNKTVTPTESFSAGWAPLRTKSFYESS